MFVVAHSVILLLAVRKHHFRGFQPVSPLFYLLHLYCKSKDHFLRRHVRLRKYFSACKRARRPPWADGACAAVRPQTPLSKKRRFFDSLTPWVCAHCTGSWGFSLFRALAAQGKDQQRQQRAGEIARRVEPDVRDLPAAAGHEELDRLVAQCGERAGQQRSHP